MNNFLLKPIYKWGIFIVFAILLAACTPSTTSTPSNGEGVQAEGEQMDAAAEQTGPSGTLRYGNHRPPRSWNPHQGTGGPDLLYFQLNQTSWILVHRSKSRILALCNLYD